MTKSSRFGDSGLRPWVCSRVRWQCLEDGLQSLWGEELEGSAVGKAAGIGVKDQGNFPFFSMQLFCSVFVNLNHTIWWLLAPWGVSWGIAITVLNVVMCWMFFHPTEREERANQCLERKSCCSQRALYDLLKKKDNFYVLALTYQGKNWGGIGCLILTLCNISISSIMVT